MRQPASLHSRPVQSDAPRVQCCFHAAVALGLLHVTQTLHRAAATEEIPRFRALEEAERLWAVLEAMWHRVHWTALGPSARGHADTQQAGRAWLGAELARRAKPLVFDRSLTS